MRPLASPRGVAPFAVLTVSVAALALARSPARAGEPTADTAKKAEAFLQRHCARCHAGGQNQGGLGYVLDARRLVETGRVVPGKPERSQLLDVVLRHEMPDDDKTKPTDDEIADLRAWIEASCPDLRSQSAGGFRSRISVESEIEADVEKLPEADRAFARYFTFTHLANAGRSQDELQSWRNGLSKLVNSLSWKKTIVAPKPIDAAKTILRVDIRDYDWTRSTWEQIFARYPYAIERGKREILSVRGDWFVAEASRPPLYHRILQLPEKDRELEKLLEIDVERDIAERTAKRSGFHASGVDAHSRLVERHASRHGAYWKSYEFLDDGGVRNFWVRPIAPWRPDTHAEDVSTQKPAELDFQHDASEILFNLPNGLEAFMVVDQNGNRIDRVPLPIGWNREQKAGSVEIQNGVSCMGCHFQGVRGDHDDQIRGYHALANTVDKKLYEEEATEAVKKLYPRGSDMRKLIEDDRALYRKAVELTGGTVGKKTEQVAALAAQLALDVDATLAAAELGLDSPGALVEKLKGSQLAALAPLARGEAVTRAAFQKAFPDAVRALKVGTPIPRTLESDETGASVGKQRFEAPFGDRVLSVEVDRSWRLVERKNGLTITRDDKAAIRLEAPRSALASFDALVAQEKELLGARLHEAKAVDSPAGKALVETFDSDTAGVQCIELVLLGKGRTFRVRCQADVATFGELRSEFERAIGTASVTGKGEVDPISPNALPEKLVQAGFENTLDAALARAKKENKLVFVYAKPDPNWFT